MTTSEEEFLKAMQSYVPPAAAKEEYRAYYDENKCITGFGASGFPENNDNWVNISRELYVTHNWTNLKLVDGEIKYVAPVYLHFFPLTKRAESAKIKVVKNHAGIILEAGEEYANVEYYDNRNN